MRGRLLMAFGTGAVVAGLVAGGAAVAQSENETEYTGCIGIYGLLYLVAEGDSPHRPCPERAGQITWNQQGQPGPMGPAGPQGEPGPPAPPGGGAVVAFSNDPLTLPSTIDASSLVSTLDGTYVGYSYQCYNPHIGGESLPWVGVPGVALTVDVPADGGYVVASLKMISASVGLNNLEATCSDEPGFVANAEPGAFEPPFVRCETRLAVGGRAQVLEETPELVLDRLMALVHEGGAVTPYWENAAFGPFDAGSYTVQIETRACNGAAFPAVANSGWQLTAQPAGGSGS